VGIRDIAEEAGVSISTVSKILNNKTDGVRIGEKTRQRVSAIAQRMGYQPNPFASALRSNRSGIIGAVNLNPGGWFMGRLGMEVQLAARQQGIELFVGTVRSRADSVEAQLTILQGQLFDGFLLLGDMPNYRDLANNLKNMNKPFVSVAAGTNIEVPMVHTDEARGIKMILDYLTGLGHQRIAFMGSLAWPLVPERLQLFQEYLATKGLALPDTYVSNMDYFPYQPEKFAAIERLHRVAIQHSKVLLQQPNPPTAIVCAADGFALGALKGAAHLGLAVPHDVSVTSFDGTDGTFTCQPELTSLRRPIEKVANEAIALLLALIDAPDDPALQKRVLVEPELIVRESCAPA
jgi:LacI family transcriptional regulator